MPRGRFSNSPITQSLETSYSLKNSKVETSYSLKNKGGGGGGGGAGEGALISVRSAPLQKEFSMALEERRVMLFRYRSRNTETQSRSL